MPGIKSLDDVYEQLSKDEVTLQTKFSYSSDKTQNKTKQMSLGRIWFNLILPDDFELIDYPVDKKELNKITLKLIDKYESDVVSEVLSTLKKEAFKLATIQPISFHVDEIILPDFIEKKRQELKSANLSNEEFIKRATELSEEYLEWLKENDSDLYQLITSGAKGGIKELLNIMITRGPTIDIENNIDPPITSSLDDGYNIKEYFQAAKVARRNFYLVAQGTAEPGALARRIAYSNCNIVLVSGDCKTKKYLEIPVNDRNKNLLFGRYYYDEKAGKLVEITPNNIDKLMNKKIKLRSPLYCKSEGDTICEICYGRLSKKLKSKYVGLLASSAINDALVQGHSMSSKHSTGSVKLKPVDFTKDIIF